MSASDKLSRLLGNASEADRTELSTAIAARDLAMKAYSDRPGRQTREDYDAAREFLDEVIERQTARNFPESVAPEGERFRNRKQAHDWLQAQGYKVSRGKFYQDCAAGFPVIHRDGTISRYQVMQYGQQQDIDHRAGRAGCVDAEAHEDRKAKADADIKEMQAEKMRREQDAEWLRSEDAWAAIAALVGRLRDAMRHHFHVGQAELVHLAGGDLNRSPEVYEGCEQILARAFNEVAAGGAIDGIFTREEDLDETATQSDC